MCLSVSQNVAAVGKIFREFLVAVQKYFIAYSKRRNSYKATIVPTATVHHEGNLNVWMF
jgi:hypothetical protein